MHCGAPHGAPWPDVSASIPRLPISRLFGMKARMKKIQGKFCLGFIEILGAVSGIAGSYCLATSSTAYELEMVGWALFLVANLSWIISAIYRKVMPLLIMNLFYMGSSIIGVLKVSNIL